MIFADLLRQLVSVLRYFAPPLTGLLITWIVDDGHDVIRRAVEATYPWVEPPSPWPLVSFLAIVGVVVYFVHRIVIHPIFVRVFVSVATRNKDPRPGKDALAFARWYRRSAPEHSPERSAQSELDVANSASHFFYCSGYASLLLAGLFKLALPCDFSVPHPLFFATIVFLFVALGLVADFQTTIWDVNAFEKYPKGNGTD